MTIVERVTRFMLVRRVAAKEKSEGMDAVIEMPGPLLEEAFRTLTVGNGREFAGFEWRWQVFSIDISFARPCYLWKARRTETATASSARSWSKGSAFDDITDGKPRRIADLLNDPPFPCLSWYTPARRSFARLLRHIFAGRAA